MPTVSQQRHKTRKLRSRVVAHAKAGKPSRVLIKAYHRAKAELAVLVRRRARAARLAGPNKALAWARAQVGITENPPGSNRNPRNITLWQSAFGSWLIGLPWCGVFVGTALKAAGVAVTPRVASVAAIEDDARAGRNGFERLVTIEEARPGDVVCLFGRGVHTELIAAIDRKNGVIHDYGGNTSFSSAGSQSNGGAVAARTRAFSDIHCIARPAYPHS